MKRIWILLVLTICVKAYSQSDTITMDMLPQATTLNAADKFWILQSGVDKYIEKQNFIHWNIGTGTLYVPDITRRVGIGTTSPHSDYMLDVKGDVRVTGDFYPIKIYIGGAYIRESYNNLEFYDPTYGSPISLSELVQTSQTLNSGNAITIDGSNNIDWGGTADANMNINTGSYHVNIWNNYDDPARIQYFDLYRDRAMIDYDDLYLYGRHRHTIIGDSVELGYTAANGWYVRDKRVAPLGLSYYADYSDSIKMGNNRIASTLTVAKMINDSSEAGGWAGGGGITKAEAIDTVSTHPFRHLVFQSGNDSIVGDGSNFIFYLNTSYLGSMGLDAGNKFYWNSDLLTLNSLTADPESNEGTIYYNSDDEKFYVRTSSSWDILNADLGNFTFHADSATVSGDTIFFDKRVKVDTIDATVVNTPGIFNVLNYGAVGDGATINTIAFQSTVDAAEAAGGGIVYIPIGSYYIDSTITITEDKIHIVGQGLKSSITFKDDKTCTIGFHFIQSGSQVSNCSVKNLYIWLEQDTITAIKFAQGIFCDVSDVYIRNVTGTKTETTGIALLGTGNWGGGNNINRVRTSDVLIGIYIDSTCNHNIITNSWIMGHTGGWEGSSGLKLYNSGASGCNSQYISGNDFEGWEVAIRSVEQSRNQIIGNRFEGNDTCIYIIGTNNGGYISGNSYTTGMVNVYTGTGLNPYITKIDPTDGLTIGTSSSTKPPRIFLVSNMYDTIGGEIKIMNSYVSSTGKLLDLAAYANYSHTNLFGEEISDAEGLITGDYLLKIGTPTNRDLSFYTNSIERMKIENYGGTSTVDTIRIIGDEILCFGDDCITFEDIGGGGGTPAGSNYQFQYYNGGNFGASANFGFGANTDTLKYFGNWKFYENSTGDLVFNNGTTDMFELDQGGTWSGGTNQYAAVIKSTASSSSPTFSWDSDDNTGLVRLAADRIGVQAGGDNTLILTKDSILAKDSIYLDYLTSPTEYGWMVMDSANKTLFVDSLADAGFGLTDNLLPIDSYLKDLQNDELKWYYAKDKFSYGLKNLRPTEAVTALTWQTEHLLRYVSELEKKNKELNDRLESLEQMLGIVYAGKKHIKSYFR